MSPAVRSYSLLCRVSWNEISFEFLLFFASGLTQFPLSRAAITIDHLLVDVCQLQDRARRTQRPVVSFLM